MTLLTLFSAPKPFVDRQIAMIQMNALASWTKLDDVEVLLMGEEQGIAEAAKRMGVRHITGVRRNERGTPLISSMLELARGHSGSRLLCIVNADMLILEDFVRAASLVAGLRRQFVMLGRRWDVDVTGALDFSDGWEGRLREQVRRSGELHRPAGSDFFLFPRECYAAVPDFAVGRAGWDNWMIYEARRQRLAVIDATPSLMIVHQNHGYDHLPGGMSHHSVPETDMNIQLAGGEASIRYTVLDATHVLESGRLKRPVPTYARFLRRLEVLLRAIFFFLPPRMIEDFVRPKRWKKRLMRLGSRDDAAPRARDEHSQRHEGS